MSFAFLFPMMEANALVLDKPVDLFQPMENAFGIEVAEVLDAGTVYEYVDQMQPTEGTIWGSYFNTYAPIIWWKISYTDRNGIAKNGWIVSNPEVITGIKMSTPALSAPNTNTSQGNSNQALEPNLPNMGTAFVLCESLTIRNSPMVNAVSLGTLGYGATCTVHSQSDNWYYISAYKSGNRIFGWIRNEYVLLNPSYYSPSAESPVYAYNSTSAKRVGLIDAGQSFPIIADLNGFYVISIRGGSGFVVK